MTEPTKMVQCEITDSNWRERFPDGIINLEVRKAKALSAKGMCKILDEDDLITKEKTSNIYKTKVMTAQANPFLTRQEYSVKKNIKIGWIQDYSKPNGGAELSNKYIVSIGENLGFEIVPIIPSQFNKRVLLGSDIIIINNMHEFPGDKILIIFNAIYERRIPYIKYEHDLRELHRTDFSRQLFSQALFNIFISPAHLNRHAEILGEHIRDRSYTLPISINVNIYKRDTNIKRKKGTVFVPAYNKGKQNIIDYVKAHPQYEYKMLGPIDAEFDKKIKIEHIPTQAPEDMVKYYNECEFMLHLPETLWAGERIYFEAKLCGCKPIVNGNVGHESWGFKTNTLEKKLTEANYTFWRMVENARTY